MTGPCQPHGVSGCCGTCRLQEALDAARHATAAMCDCVRRRLLQRLVPGNDGCLLWTGQRDRYGYGVISADGRKHSVHRLAYVFLVGPIEPGLTLDHLCRVKHCAAPAHLEPVTSAENTRRAAEARRSRSHCRRGHLFDDANTQVMPDGSRRCRTCNRDGQARRMRQKRALTSP